MLEPLNCSTCKFTFDNTLLLITHLRNLKDDEFHKNSDYICPFCLLNFDECIQFTNHLTTNHNSNAYFDPNILSNSPKKHVKTPNKTHELGNIKPFKCINCDVTFSRKYNLKQHLLTHNRESSSTYQCSVCQKSFFSRSALKLHFRIHNKNSPFKCEYVGCLENFRTKKLMKTHIKRAHFAIQPTNKRDYSSNDAQRVARKIAELCGKTINEELPLKKSANSAFSSLPKRQEPERLRGRASLDITYNSFYYNNCMQMQSTSNVIPRRFGSANLFVPNLYDFRNNNNL